MQAPPLPPAVWWELAACLPCAFSFLGKWGQQTPVAYMSGAGPAALRLGRAELAWLGVVTGLVPVAAVGAGPPVAGGKGSGSLLCLPCPPQGISWALSGAPSWARIRGSQPFSASGKLPVLFQLRFPVSRLVPQMVLRVSGAPGALPAGKDPQSPAETTLWVVQTRLGRGRELSALPAPTPG